MMREGIFAGKKILLFPGSTIMCSVVEQAKKMGLYTIVTDFYTDWDMAPAKKIADEAFDISFNDFDSIIKLCQAKKIDGVFSAFSEFSIMAAAKICEMLDMPFYATVEQLEIMSDKAKFKALCEKNGLRTVKEYSIDLTNPEETIARIEYPVVVKPVDNAGSRGITVACDEAMLRESIGYALSYSASKKIIVEQYMTGQECCLTYSLQNGECVLSTMSDAQLSLTPKGQLNLPFAWLYPSKHYWRCLNEVNPLIKKMFRSIGMKEGCCFMTCFVEEDGIYFFEAGYRVGGGMNFLMQDKVYGKNYLELMLAYSITGDSCVLYDLSYDDFASFKPCGNLVIVLKGGTITEYVGFDKISDIDGVIDVGRLKPIGTTIHEVGDYGQNLCRVIIVAKSAEHFAKVIDEIYNTIDVLDENGNSMLLGKMDTDIVRNYWE